jgi:hypothetical protein
MELKQHPDVGIPANLLEAIRSFPLGGEIEHCGCKVIISPFDYYAQCSQCGKRIKVRAFSAGREIEDVFDAVFEWMNQPGAEELVRQRRKAIEADAEE